MVTRYDLVDVSVCDAKTVPLLTSIVCHYRPIMTGVEMACIDRLMHIQTNIHTNCTHMLSCNQYTLYICPEAVFHAAVI